MEDDARRHRHIERMLGTALYDFHHLIALGQCLIGYAADLVAQHECKRNFGAKRYNGSAAVSLFDCHGPAAGIAQGAQAFRSAFMSRPLHAFRGTESGFQDFPVGRAGRNAAADNFFHTKRIRTPENASDVESAADLIQYYNDRNFRRIAKRLHAEALQFIHGTLAAHPAKIDCGTGNQRASRLQRSLQ